MTDVEQAAQEAVARAKAMSDSAVERAAFNARTIVNTAIADAEKVLSKQTIADAGEKVVDEATAEVVKHPKGSFIAATVLAGFFAIAAFGQHYALKSTTRQNVTLSHQIADANADRTAISLQLQQATKRAETAESARVTAEARVCKPKIITRTVKVTVPAKAPVRHTFRLPLVQSGQ